MQEPSGLDKTSLMVVGVVSLVFVVLAVFTLMRAGEESSSGVWVSAVVLLGGSGYTLWASIVGLVRRFRASSRLAERSPSEP